MALNPYTNFNTPTNEQSLINDLFAESVKFWGVNVNYIPRTLVNEDTLFHEDAMSSFDGNTEIEMYVESYESFDGQDDFVAQLGLQLDDSLNLSVSRQRFLEELGYAPKEGDLIYYPTTNSLFEIQFVEDEEQFFPLGAKPSYKLKTTLFRYNQNDMDTGIKEVDAIETTYDVSDTGTDPFADNISIELEADTILDFNEKSPFGDY